MDLLFPSYASGQEVPNRLLEVVRFCADAGLPFPAEPNDKYSVWWRSLHEIGHWAIKPEFYYTGELGGRVIPILGAEVTLNGIKRAVTYYEAGNDVIPDAELPEGRDPTPNELEVRPWAIRTMQALGYEHPFREILQEGRPVTEVKKLGDAGWHKPASMRVWAPTSQLRPLSIRSMTYFGIDPLEGNYRADGKGFIAPYPYPKDLDEKRANMVAMRAAYQEADKLRLPDFSDSDREMADLYHLTYEQWLEYTKAGQFPVELQGGLLRQHRDVEEYCTERFNEQRELVQRG